MQNYYTVHIHYNGKTKLERHFKITQENFETWLLYHAFWGTSYVEVYNPLTEICGIKLIYHWLDDYIRNEKWLDEHKPKQEN